MATTMKNLHADRAGIDAPSRTPQRRSRAGFTLMELVMVLTVSGILMTIVVPRIDVQRFQLDTAVQEVASAISSSRGQAILKQHDYVLTFDQDNDRFFVLADANNNGEVDEGEENRVTELSEGVKFSRGGATAIRGESNGVSFKKKARELPALKFHRNGASSEEGIIYLTSVRADAADGSEQDTRALKIERSTGQVICMTFRTETWEEGC